MGPGSFNIDYFFIFIYAVDDEVFEIEAAGAAAGEISQELLAFIGTLGQAVDENIPQFGFQL